MSTTFSQVNISYHFTWNVGVSRIISVHTVVHTYTVLHSKGVKGTQKKEWIAGVACKPEYLIYCHQIFMLIHLCQSCG